MVMSRTSLSTGVDLDATRAATFSLDAPSRSLCALAVDGLDPTLHVFACAATAASQPVQLYTFSDDTCQVHRHAPKQSPDARHIWALESSRSRPGFLLVTRSEQDTPMANATVAMVKIEFGAGIEDQNVQIPNPESISDVVLMPPMPSAFRYANFVGDAIVTIDSDTLRYWKVDSGAGSNPGLTDAVVFGRKADVRTGCADPHVPNRFLSATDRDVVVWDWRDPSSDGVVKVEGAHPSPIRDLDVNPNKPHQIVTAGEDASVRFWDLRRPDSPALIMFGHTHWIWQIQYNHHHDQLVLTASSDCTACLWNAYSVSSSSSVNMMIGETADNPNRVVEIVRDHEDSVYRACWSATDPWVYASLAYDGRVVVNVVPQAEKYKILL